ncbi:arrestin domain-containing protein 3-like [Patiria miniata]|uniref:Arrestin C-terminal-like domain-containing protein n=1 Tax=Patiria miniata TaxID=46514 RepID=A0A914B5E4_PATMI|nr:arrestin domain-containing protein 3-like [Patiria miniata]
MGKLKTFVIVFDGDDLDVFSSGDVISGYIKIVLAAPKDDVKSIKIKFKGKAHTHWSEGSGDDKKTYEGNETYFKDKITCWGKDDSGKRVLEEGEHRFPFSFKIPDVPLPFPFESSVGWIRYKVMCKIDRPWKFDHETQRLFTVTGQPIDLGQIPMAMYPVSESDTNTVCCCCCATGPIITNASVDKAGYVPGETMFVFGTVENNSTRKILCLNVRLKQYVKFFSSSGRHSTSREYNVMKEKAPGCEEGETARMDWKPHIIPPIPPTGPQGCNIIKIGYAVHFEGDIENTPFDAEVFLPITIGTVPVYRPVYPDPTAVVVHQPASNVLPPPSYEVAIDGLQEIPSKSGHDYTFGKLMYAPQYPTYNLPAMPPTWDPAHPPPVGDPTYPPGGYPPPDQPGYPPATGYPPAGAEGYPPPAAAGAQGYPPPDGAQGYPPPAGAQGYPPPAGAQSYPPPAGAVVNQPTAGAQGYPPPAGAQGYPPPAGAQSYPPPAGAQSYPPPAGAVVNQPTAGAQGYPPPAGAEGYPSPADGEVNQPPAGAEIDPPPADGEGNPSPAEPAGEGSGEEKPLLEETEGIELHKI